MPPSTYIPLSQRTTTPKTAGISIPETSRLAYINNNPGNLRFAGQQGAVEGEGGFAKFNSPEEGYEGLKRQIKLDTSRGLDLRGFVSKYAPPTENDTEEYIKQLTEWTGADETTLLSELDLDTLAGAVAKKESSTTTAQKAGKTFGGVLSKYIPLAMRTAQAIPSETAKLFGGAIQKTGEGLNMLASSLETPLAPKYVPIKDRKAQMTRAVETPQIDPTGIIGSVAKTGKAIANIHPDDLYAMTKYIDAVRIKEEVPEGIMRGAEALAQKFGISLDQPVQKIASKFEKILQGSGGVDTVVKDASRRLPVQEGKINVPGLLATGAGTAFIASMPSINENIGKVVENLPDLEISKPLTFDEYQKSIKQEESFEITPGQDEKLVKNIAEAISVNETGGVGDDVARYSLRKPSGSEVLGDDLGRYQITEGVLKQLSKKYLGRLVSPEEFIATPALQDQFIRNRIKNLLSQGYTPQQIADHHRSGNMKDEPGGSELNRPEYVEKFNESFERYQQMLEDEEAVI